MNLLKWYMHLLFTSLKYLFSSLLRPKSLKILPSNRSHHLTFLNITTRFNNLLMECTPQLKTIILLLISILLQTYQFIQATIWITLLHPQDSHQGWTTRYQDRRCHLKSSQWTHQIIAISVFLQWQTIMVSPNTSHQINKLQLCHHLTACLNQRGNHQLMV